MTESYLKKLYKNVPSSKLWPEGMEKTLNRYALLEDIDVPSSKLWPEGMAKTLNRYALLEDIDLGCSGRSHVITFDKPQLS
jgi:uncharacterized protein YeaO (DUF488 family)